ncbi:MAG: hypothetical protein J0I67_10060, partial [Bosea sp.]|nr:hypothetical protein [Bosea sp. (in: a-proteobacteria)]
SLAPPVLLIASARPARHVGIPAKALVPAAENRLKFVHMPNDWTMTAGGSLLPGGRPSWMIDT